MAINPLDESRTPAPPPAPPGSGGSSQNPGADLDQAQKDIEKQKSMLNDGDTTNDKGALEELAKIDKALEKEQEAEEKKGDEADPKKLDKIDAMRSDIGDIAKRANGGKT